MNEAIAQCPIIGEVETQSQQPARSVRRPAVIAKTDSPAALYAAKFIVIFSGVAMMYCLFNYGRIYQNYLQW